MIIENLRQISEGTKPEKLVIRKVNNSMSKTSSQSKERFLAKEIVLRDPQNMLPKNMAHQTNYITLNHAPASDKRLKSK